jgi:TolB-like protein
MQKVSKGSNKDGKYDKVKKMIEAGIITEFKEIFDVISRTEISRKIKKNTARDFTQDAEKLSTKHVIEIGKILDVKPGLILDLINNQYQKKLAALAAAAAAEETGKAKPKQQQ